MLAVIKYSFNHFVPKTVRVNLPIKLDNKNNIKLGDTLMLKVFEKSTVILVLEKNELYYVCRVKSFSVASINNVQQKNLGWVCL